MEIQILNLNPSFDHTGVLKHAANSNIVRVDEVFPLASGKGIDIGRVLEILGLKDYTVANLLGGGVGKLIKNCLEQEDINSWNYWIEGENRINYALVKEVEAETLMINEKGPYISPEEKNRYLEKLFDWFKPGQVMVMAGSATTGFDNEDIRKILKKAREKDMYIAIDSSKSYLKACLKEDFDFLKINQEEFKNAYKDKYSYDFEEKEDYINVIKKEKLNKAIITFGKEGALLSHEDTTLFGRNQKLFSNYAIGSGDSFLAGYMYGFVNDFTEIESLKLAMACGAANTRQYGPGKISYDHVQEIEENYIKIEELDY